MRHIYSKASKVLIWLGEEDEEEGSTELAFDMMSRFAYLYGQRVFSQMWDQIEGEEHKFEAVKRLLQRPYFQRVWIIQEIVLSRDAVVVCGRYSRPWEAVYDACTWLEACGLDFVALHNEHIVAKCMSAWQEMGRKDPQLRLLRCLSQTRYSQATDPRDKVYCLLGIAMEGEDEYFQPDYSRALRQVYTAATRFIIEKDDHLEALCAVQETDSGVSELPSWVPDWRRPWVADKIGLTQRGQLTSISGGTRFHTNYHRHR